MAFTHYGNSFNAAREKLSIEEYSFSQTTLEQVFIKFAHEQEDEDEETSHDNTKF